MLRLKFLHVDPSPRNHQHFRTNNDIIRNACHTFSDTQPCDFVQDVEDADIFIEPVEVAQEMVVVDTTLPSSSKEEGDESIQFINKHTGKIVVYSQVNAYEFNHN